MSSCSVCDRPYTEGANYCRYGCQVTGNLAPFQMYSELCRYDKYKIKDILNTKSCKICCQKFIAKRKVHVICSKKCRKEHTRREANKYKIRAKSKREKYASTLEYNPSDEKLTPEQKLINQEVAERESRLANQIKIQCDYCRLYFRTYDKEKLWCSDDCKKKREKAIVAKKAKDKLKASKAKTCSMCKVKFRSSLDKTMYQDCHSQQKKENERQEYLNRWKNGEDKYKDQGKRNRKLNINERLERAALHSEDPVTRRLKVMRG